MVAVGVTVADPPFSHPPVAVNVGVSEGEGLGLSHPPAALDAVYGSRVSEVVDVWVSHPPPAVDVREAATIVSVVVNVLKYTKVIERDESMVITVTISVSVKISRGART